MIQVISAAERNVNPGPTKDTPNLVVVSSKNNAGLEASSDLRQHNVTADVMSRQSCYDNPVVLTMISEATLYAEAALQKHTHTHTHTHTQ